MSLMASTVPKNTKEFIKTLVLRHQPLQINTLSKTKLQISYSGLIIYSTTSLSVDLSVCLCVQTSRSHFCMHRPHISRTCNLIQTPGRFLHAFWLMLPFLISSVTLNLIPAALPIFQSPLFQPPDFIMTPFHSDSNRFGQFCGSTLNS